MIIIHICENWHCYFKFSNYIFERTGQFWKLRDINDRYPNDKQHNTSFHSFRIYHLNKFEVNVTVKPSNLENWSKTGSLNTVI